MRAGGAQRCSERTSSARWFKCDDPEVSPLATLYARFQRARALEKISMSFHIARSKTASKAELYANLQLQLRGLFAGETDFIANAANFSSLLYHSLTDINWVGFYLLKDGELVLGPFQGQPACIRIAMGQGVCGTAAEQRQTILVDDVHEFPGHIACDSASNSEIVVPLIVDDQLIGVLDLDSPLRARFDDEDARGLNELVNIFVGAVKEASSSEFKL
jgi:GAF domain-containing protein